MSKAKKWRKKSIHFSSDEKDNHPQKGRDTKLSTKTVDARQHKRKMGHNTKRDRPSGHKQAKKPRLVE